jgi:hypothetical protein
MRVLGFDRNASPRPVADSSARANAIGQSRPDAWPHDACSDSAGIDAVVAARGLQRPQRRQLARGSKKDLFRSPPSLYDTKEVRPGWGPSRTPLLRTARGGSARG